MAIITEELGDIFSAPPKSILIHACNARGAWGSGVAVTFKQKYPYAFHKYNTHCLSPPTGSKLTVKQHQASIVGTTLLISPPNERTQRQASSKTSHHIACLFTSLDYGKKVAPPEEILENTKKAIGDLANQVAEMRKMDEEMGNCYAVRINSGRFGVEWQKTKAVLEAGELDITIFRPEEEEEADRASTAAGGKLGRLPTKGEKAPVGINARTCNPWASGRAKAQGPFGKQLRGVKRKAERDLDGDDDPDGEDMEETERVQSHSEIAKRREKLGLQS